MPPQPNTIKAVIWDLDGLLLDTESLVVEASNRVLQRYGKSLTAESLHAGVGKRPLEAWAAVAKCLGLDGVDPQQLYDESEPLLTGMWAECRLLPGVARLLGHLRDSGVAMGLATSTPRATLLKKLSRHSGVEASFGAVTCGDEVANGKPAPDCFLAVARALGVEPRDCLVLEDAPSGVQAATAAGMRVVAVPSLPDRGFYPEPDSGAASGCVGVLPSLLEFSPQAYGLPPFRDVIAGEAIPLAPPLRLRGPVARGFGRGSRELGIRTANLDAAALAGSLAEAVTGIFLGWASVGADPTPHKMVMSIGWNPFFSNKEKTAEPWILHDFGRDFYGEELRLLVCGYVRPERNFPSLDDLSARIQRDGDVAREALDHPRLAAHRDDPFLRLGGWGGASADTGASGGNGSSGGAGS